MELRKLAIGIPNSLKKGFTFIELMVVLLIISIVFTITILSFGDFGDSRKALLSLEALKQDLLLLKDEAILENSTFSLSFNNRGYQVFKFINNNWQKYDRNKKVLSSLDTNFSWSINKANILITPTGELSPFVLTLKNNNSIYGNLKSDGNGKLSIQTSK